MVESASTGCAFPPIVLLGSKKLIMRGLKSYSLAALATLIFVAAGSARAAPPQSKLTAEDTQGRPGHTVTLRATLVDDKGHPIKHGIVIFSVNGRTAGVTVADGHGIASVEWMIPKPTKPGSNFIYLAQTNLAHYRDSQDQANIKVLH